MAGDLWETAVNIHPSVLAELRGKRKRQESQSQASEADDKESRKFVQLSEILRHQFDIRNKMGSVHRNQRRFDSLTGIREALRYTTGRREDAPRLGRQHIRSGRIRFQQAKNEHRSPIDIDIPLHPDLAASIAASKLGNMTFLITEYGKPFTANGFGNKFKDWCRQADLPHCSAHGVRKATSTALAEAGATPHEIMAITGHQTLEEVERYTKTASRKKTADAAMAKLK